LNAENPVPEVAPVGPHPTDPNRNALGRYAKNNDGHTETKVYSAKEWAALAPRLHADQIEILAAKGFTEEDADPVMRYATAGLIQAKTIADHYFQYLMQAGGPVSPKGRTRRAVEGWSRAVDRVAKFSAMLGLQRQPRRIAQSTLEWLEGTETTDMKGVAQHEHSPGRSD
jgi:hypothetical protein